jgi:hypothetical protein
MTEDPVPQKIPLIFFRSGKGTEPVREWLRELRKPNVRPSGKICYARNGAGRSECVYAERWATAFWEIGTDLPTKRTARAMLCLYRGHFVALDGFIKKTRATPGEDLALARKRQKELMR